MLKNKNRLQKNREFTWVFKNSKPIYCGNLLFRVSPQKIKTGSVRFGFVVSNKIEKRATRRNKLKRYLRNAAADVLPSLPVSTNIVVIVKNNFPYPYKREEIEEQFAGGLKRAGLV